MREIKWVRGGLYKRVMGVERIFVLRGEVARTKLPGYLLGSF
jgi:hypothetical protein